MVSKTCHLNVPTTKYRYRLPITTPQSPSPAVTDYMKMTVLAPKSGSTTVGTLSLRLEVRCAKIDRGGGGANSFSLANVEVSIWATGCTLQSPSAGGVIDAVVSKVTWTEPSLDDGDNKDYSVDFKWPTGKRSFDFVLKADELERFGVIANVRVVLP